MVEDHEGTLEYTIDDNGIWLECSCGFRINLGFHPSPREVAKAWLDHLDNERT